ncbi:MAG: multidrug effflux MFS transporter [Candidatus Latescibacteria bacterium]|nr:multidrug effflux MFS transporter [Candidatus Latescibacterota bacterium]
MEKEETSHSPGFGEFVALIGMMMSLVALSIDAMLPALPEIGRDLGVDRENDNQLIISFVFIGYAVGQLIYGPLSDSTGRKPAIYVGFSLFIIGCLLSLFAADFSTMLAGRLMQGLGAAGNRTVCVALIRDRYEGRAMAQVMSSAMSIFILVPVIAPALGQGLLLIAHWRAIFVAFLALALIILTWFTVRQPETLARENRRAFSLRQNMRAVREICSTRVSFGYTIAVGLISGGFLAYLTSSQQIFQDQYGVGTRFPLYFATLALALGGASFANSRLVMRYGMRVLSRVALYLLSILSIIFFTISWFLAGDPPLWGLMTYFMLLFFCIGLLFGNLNALAMEPLGHIAGIGASVVGALSSLLSVPIGILIGQSFNGTILPLVGGYGLLGLGTLAVMWWTESKKAGA